jgi:hypothetical protein
MLFNPVVAPKLENVPTAIKTGVYKPKEFMYNLRANPQRWREYWLVYFVTERETFTFPQFTPFVSVLSTTATLPGDSFSETENRRAKAT